MTWKEFKDLIESRGVKDGDELWYIDVHDPSPQHVEVERRPFEAQPEDKDDWGFRFAVTH